MTTDTEKTPADASQLVLAVLGERLRLVDDPLQWIVERWKGKAMGWRPMRYHRDRDALLVWLKHEGALPEAIATVSAFPRWHP